MHEHRVKQCHQLNHFIAVPGGTDMTKGGFIL